MTINNDRYLLRIEYLPVNTEIQSQGQPPLISARPTLEQALVDLLTQPMDSFHPASAKQMGMDYFIHQARIMDMKNGEHVITFLRMNNDMPVLADIAVYLAIEPGQATAAISRMTQVSQEILHRQGTKLLPLLALEPVGQFLYPMTIYRHLAASAFHDVYHLEAALFPCQFLTRFDGISLNESSVRETGYQQKGISIKHFYPTEKDALAKLLLTPPLFFDIAGSARQDAPYYFIAACAGNISSEEYTAATHTIQPPTLDDDHTYRDAGRYLACPEGWASLLDKIGFPYDPDHIPNFGATLLKLDYWNTAIIPALVKTELSERITEHLEAQLNLQQVDQTYLSYIRSTPQMHLPELDNGKVSVADNELHSHSNNLATALAQMLIQDFREFDLNLVTEKNLAHHITSAYLSDPAGKELMHFRHVAQDGPDLKRGVYMGVHKDLVGDPAFAMMEPHMVAQAERLRGNQKGDYVYLQVARYNRLGNLVEMPLYDRFFVSATHRQIALQADIDPALYKTIPNTLPANMAYKVQLQWEYLGNPAPDGPLRFSYFQGFGTPERAMQAISKLSNELFDSHSQLQKDTPFRIVDITLFNQDNKAILIKSGEMDGPGIYHEKFLDYLTPRIQAAYDHFLGRGSSAGQQKGQDPPDKHAKQHTRHRPRIQRGKDGPGESQGRGL
ncbi:hypothetical protein HB364_13855 [Pseudoflavitalea sp. X16]|uniref:hypothetical protein n=1 Tax=Paraflavitalea devenefica TaxID=2716334 RepID=UPI001421CE52|nr:hypothetical protein [Paraflavitalea devenefica]NII26173.1 hypothetical protein [Paraflavitalea devenefica]